MERITSRKNRLIVHLRTLAADREYRRAAGEYLCEGEKQLREALACGAGIGEVLYAREPDARLPESVRMYEAPKELLDYVSPLKNAPGPLFTVRIEKPSDAPIRSAILLENVQDPGNVGTVIRTANAFGADAVILTGESADPYNFKSVRAAMGALFRQRVVEATRTEAVALIRASGLKLYGAALSAAAQDVRKLDLRGTAVAVGSEGQGLSTEMLALCDGEVVIPMLAHSESLNAAVAASVLLWEMNGGELPCPC
jgi:TrmH family RNA methyltransferase